MPADFQTVTLAGMARELHRLLIEVSAVPPYPGVFPLYVWPGKNPRLLPDPLGRKWCDLRAGDEVRDAFGNPRRVVRVIVDQATPDAENGRVVESGRAWLAGG